MAAAEAAVPELITMADCGIKRYDALPAVVDGIDVDYLRFRLSRCLEKSRINIINRVRAKWKDEISDMLEAAVLIQKRRTARGDA